MENLLEGQHESQRLCKVCLLRRQLTLRYGPLPDWADQQLSQATTQQLKAWALRVLDATSLDSVLRG